MVKTICTSEYAEQLQAPVYQRTMRLVGEEAMCKLLGAQVAVCGLGGVGSAAAEALARAGVGSLRLIDFDDIDATNLNRQLHTNLANVGEVKANAMAERIAGIIPQCKVEVIAERISAENVAELISGCDYVVDAIDDVPAKLALACACREQGIPIVMSMGTGNKLHPEMLTLADISKTSVCPLAKKIRVELRKRGIEKGIAVVYSEETPTRADKTVNTPASVSFVPPVAGYILAGKVIRDLAGLE